MRIGLVGTESNHAEDALRMFNRKGRHPGFAVAALWGSDASRTEELAERYGVSEIAAAPDELYIDAIVSAPMGKPGVIILAPVWSGPAGDADHVLAPLRKLGTPLSDTIKAWDYTTEAGARAFFQRWRDGLKWQRLEPYEKFAAMIDRHWDGIAAYCNPKNKVSLGVVEGINNKIRVIQRKAYGYRDEDYLSLKIVASFLPALPRNHVP